MTQERMTFSFRCPRSLKEAFSTKAKAHGTTASALIKDFMQAYVDGSYDTSTDKKGINSEKCNDNNGQSTDTDDNGIDNQRIEELEMAIVALQNELANHQQQINDMAEAIELQDNAYDGLQNEVRSQQAMMDGLSCPLPEEQPTNDKISADQNDKGKGQNSFSESVKDEHSNLLTGSALGERLGCSATAIKKQWKKGEEKFKEWSRGRDPEGKAWSYDPSIGKWGKYCPIS